MNHDQFTLPFLDTTIVAEGFGLYGGSPNREILRPCADEMSSPKRPNPSTRPFPPNHLFRRRITGSPAIAVLPRVGKRAPKTISPRSDS